MCSDIGEILAAKFPEGVPPTVLMGHSMGGAIAVHAAYNNCVSSVVALIVIDVVEGTAVDALASMQSFLRSRPTSFKSVKDAITWRLTYLFLRNYIYLVFCTYNELSNFCSLYNGQVKNIESAQVSVPGQIKKLVLIMILKFLSNNLQGYC